MYIVVRSGCMWNRLEDAFQNLVVFFCVTSFNERIEVVFYAFIVGIFIVEVYFSDSEPIEVTSIMLYLQRFLLRWAWILLCPLPFPQT